MAEQPGSQMMGFVVEVVQPKSFHDQRGEEEMQLVIPIVISKFQKRVNKKASSERYYYVR